MDFEEFCLALGEAQMVRYIKECFEKRKPLERTLHEKAMLIFRQYMLNASDEEKRDILKMYREDIMKIDVRYQSKVLSIFDQIPSFLFQHEKKVVFNEVEKGSYFSQYAETFFWLGDTRMVNECFNSTDPANDLAKNSTKRCII